MADSFFGFDNSLSNLNDDEGGGEPSEDEYDALNDETFGQDSEELDWEVEHEQLANQIESGRRQNVANIGIDSAANAQLEASLSQLVLDDLDPLRHSAFGSNVWRHDPPAFPTAPTPLPTLKNVCTVEELERQLHQKQMPQALAGQSYYQQQARYPPVILQRPPGLQAPVPLPFAPNQQMSHQPLNKMTPIGQNNPMMQNHMGPNSPMNQMGQNVNHIGQNLNQIGQNVNAMGQNMNQMTQSLNQFMQNSKPIGNQFQNNMMNIQNSHPMGQMNQIGQNQLGQNNMGQNLNQMGQNLNQIGSNVNHMSQSTQSMSQNLNPIGQNMSQMGQNLNPIGQNINQMGQNVNHLGQNPNQMGQNVNQMGQNVNQMGQNVNHMGQNQMMSNGNQFGNINQFHMMNQSRMIAPPPGMNSVPRQNFNSNMGPYNPNFRGPSIQTSDQSLNQPNMMINQHQMKTPSQQIQNMKPIGQSQVNQTQVNQSPPQNNPMKNQGTNQNVGPQNVFLNLNLPNKEKDLDLLIHNTYRMFFNNSHSYHNASHHPMLNNRNNLNNQAMNNHPMFNQRHNGTFANSVRQQNGSESPTETDEYAGLMTAREKQWLINIQMLQLNTGTPYIHDFYYTVFLERQASKEKEGVKEAHKANQQNHPFYSGSVKQETNRSRHNSLRHNSSTEEAPRTYVPTQFENSLGKLQCGSVTAPRKIIDVELVSNDTGVSSARPSRAPSVASTTNPAEVPRELKRTKQLLLDIEALYLILLRLEELNDPLAISNALILKEREEKQKLLDAVAKELAALEKQFDDDSNVFLKNIESVQKRHKQDTPKADPLDKRQVVNLAVSQKPVPVKNLLDEDKDELINKMFSGLLHTDRLPQLLTVRKGKALLARFLPRVPPTHYGTRALWSRLLRAPAARRPDPALARLAPHFRTYIQSTNGWSPVLETCTIIAECLDPARTPYALTSVLMISCVCALAERAIILVNTPEATANERQWSKFLKTLARALKNTSLNVARPIQPLSEAKLSAHIKILESRSTIEILQRGRTAAEFADLSKGDLSELLIHHLC